MFAGGVRAPLVPSCLDEEFSCRCFEHFEPVEEALRLGSLCGVLASCMRLCRDSDSLILCGHSLGATVACFFAMCLSSAA